jgi:hypothetical protein
MDDERLTVIFSEKSTSRRVCDGVSRGGEAKASSLAGVHGDERFAYAYRPLARPLHHTARMIRKVEWLE